MRNNVLKRIGSMLICTVLCTTPLIPFTVAAAPEAVAVTSIRNNEITLSGSWGSGEKGKKVTILVLNPGFTLEQANENGNAIQHQWVATTDETGAFKHSFYLNLAPDFNSGIFTVYYGGELITDLEGQSFVYTSFTKQLDAAKELYEKFCAENVLTDQTAREAANQQLSDCKTLLAYDTAAFNAVDADDILGNIVKSCQSNTIDFGENEADEAKKQSLEEKGIDSLVAQIKKVAVLEAFNKGCGSVLFDQSNTIVDGDLIGLSEIIRSNTSLLPLISDIDSAGLSAINNSLLNKNFESFEELAKVYARSVIFYGIKNNKQLGFSHVGRFLTAQNTSYAGVSIPLYLSLSSTNQADSLITENKSTLTETNFSAKIEEYATYKNTPKLPSGSSSSSRNSSKMTVSQAMLPEDTEDIKQEENSSNSLQAYNDIEGYEWGFDAISFLTKAGIFSGEGNATFNPSGLLKREQAAKIICIAFNLKGNDKETDFSDVDKNAWYYDYLSKAKENSIIRGDGNNTFGVGKPITRQDFAVMLYRALNTDESANEALSQFTDMNEISDYSKEAVSFFAKKKIINGYEDNTFRPNDYVKRAEAAKMVYEIVKWEEQA